MKTPKFILAALVLAGAALPVLGDDEKDPGLQFKKS